MGRQADLYNALDRPDSSGDFGRDEGVAAYEVVAGINPDRTIEASAEIAAGVAMIATGRFDVDPRKVAQSIVNGVTSGLPELDD